MDLRNSQLGHFKSVFRFFMNKKPIREEQKNKLAKLLDWPYLDQNNLGPMTPTPHHQLKLKQKLHLGENKVA